MNPNGKIPQIAYQRLVLISVICLIVFSFAFLHVFFFWWFLKQNDLAYPDAWTLAWIYITLSSSILLVSIWLSIKHFALIPLAAFGEALRISEARLKDLIEASSDWQWETGPDLRFTHVSAKFLELMKTRPENFIGKTREEIAVPETTRTPAFKEHLEMLRQHLPFRDFHYSIECGDASVIHVSVSGKPIFDDSGNFLGYRGTATDVSEKVAAEKKAQAAHSLLVEAITAFPHGLVIWDKNDRLLLYNNAYRDFFSRGLDIGPGMSFEEVGWLLLKHGRFRIPSHNEPTQIMKERLRRHQQASGSFEARLSDGRWVLVYERKTSEGCIVGTYTDITERKYAEAAMHESEKRLQTVLDNAPAIITVKDTNGRYMYVNREYTRLLGISTEKLLGKANTLVFDQQYADKLKANDNKVISEGKALQFEEVIPINSRNHTYLSTKVPLYTTSGQLYGICCISTDIDKRKALENHLEANVAALRSLYEITSRQYADFAEKTKALLEFGCRHFALSQGIVGRTRGDKLEIIAAVSRNDTMKAGMIFNLSDTYCRETVNSSDPVVFGDIKDNPALTLHPCYILFGMETYLGARIVVGNGIYGAVGFFSRRSRPQAISIADQEIVRLIAQSLGTEIARLEIEKALMQAKEEAEIADRTKTEFLANMSHELRTPLNAIIGFSEMMAEKVMGELGCQAYEGYTKNILESGRHLLSVINDILDVAKIEAGKLDLDETEIYLPELIEACERINSVRAFDAGIRIKRHTMPDMPLILGESRRIKQVILNLISNAIKFTPRDGEITITSELLTNGDIHIAVCDTGIGMNKEEMNIALKPFGQVESQFSRKYEGTGLGLPLSKSLIELHGGSLSLESRPGKGTCVHIYLPKERVIE